MEKTLYGSMNILILQAVTKNLHGNISQRKMTSIIWNHHNTLLIY